MARYMIVCEQDTVPLVTGLGSGPVWDCPKENQVNLTFNQALEDAMPVVTVMHAGDEPYFDAVSAGAFFAFAFASTVFLWLLSLGAGSIIRMVKSA